MVNDKKKFLTSFPHDLSWVKELIDKKEKLKKIINDGLATYYLKTNGSELLYWVNENKGIILIRFIQN